MAADSITESGASQLSIEVARDGIVGRGVLLDIPRLRGLPWLEPGEQVTADDLTTAEAAQHVRIGEGDLPFVQWGTASATRRSARGRQPAHAPGFTPPHGNSWPSDGSRVLGSDGNNDTAASAVEGVEFPCTYSPSMRWGCIFWTTCSWTTWCQCARQQAAGRSCV